MAETKQTTVDSKSTDLLTKRIGEFGRWQILLFLLLAPIKLSGFTMALDIIFLAPKTTFRCVERNLTEDILNSTCYSDCVLYEYQSQFERTIISEFGLICGRAWLANLVQTVNMCGILTGSLVFGFLSDRYGRRPAILASCTLQLVTSFATAFSKHYWAFAAIRFFLGMSTGGNLISSFVMVTEIVGPSYREMVTCIYHIPTAIAEIFMPLLAYYMRSWNEISTGIALPNLIYLTYFFIVPESPKWLISMGRVEEASLVMEKAAKFNKLPSEHMLETARTMADDAKIKEEKTNTRATYMDLIKIPSLRTINLCSCIAWFILGMYFYGASQYIGQTSSNVFITMSLAGIFKIPNMVLSGYFFKRFGRRPTLFGYLICSSICSALLAVPDSWYYIKLLAGVLGVSFIIGAFTTMYTFTSELFPTVTRNMGMGASSTVSRVGSAVAPFIVGLNTEAMWLPPMVFALVPLGAIAACWILPETKGKKLADTLDEIE